MEQKVGKPIKKSYTDINNERNLNKLEGVDILQDDFDKNAMSNYSMLSVEAKILSKYYDYNWQGVDDIRQSYNQFINEDIADIVANSRLYIDDYNHYIVYTNVKVMSPYIIENGERKLIYPEYARVNKSTYETEIYATPVLKETNTGETIKTGKERMIGIFPVLLSSDICNLYPILKDKEKLAKYNEDPNSPFCYFIINGIERFIVSDEKLRQFQTIISPKNKDKTVDYISVSIKDFNKTSRILVNFEDETVNVNINSIDRNTGGIGKHNYLNVLEIVKLLDNVFLDSDGERPLLNLSKEINERTGKNHYDIIPIFRNYLLEFTRDKYKYKVMSKFIRTEIEFSNTNLGDIYNKVVDFLGASDKSDSLISHIIRYDMLTKDLFPNVDPEDIILKVKMLALMTSRLLEYLSGAEDLLDNKDDWGNKMINTPGNIFRSLFNRTWNTMVKKLSGTNNVINKGVKDFNIVEKKLTLKNFIKEVSPAFVDSNYGNFIKYAKPNITEILDNKNNFAKLFSSITQITTKLGENDKRIGVRQHGPNQYGNICPVSTPDGKKCGITKFKSITAYISTDQDPLILVEVLKSRNAFYQIRTSDHPFYVLVNGVFQGWVDMYDFYQLFVKLRRNREIHEHSECVLYPERQYIDIYTTRGRILRPLHVVDKYGYITLFERFDSDEIENMTFENMLDNGVVEFIGASETNNITIASNKHVLENWRNTNMEIINTLRNLEYDLEDVQEGSGEFYYLSKEISKYESILRNSDTYYQYAEIYPGAQFSFSASLVTFVHQDNSCRLTHAAKMAQQGLPVNKTPTAFDETKYSATLNKPLVTSSFNRTLSGDFMNIGSNVIIAFLSKTYAQEDAIIINKDSIERGLFKYIKTTIFKEYLSNTNDYILELAKDNQLPINRGKDPSVYRHLINGLPKINSYIKEGDCVIGIIQNNFRQSKIGKKNNIIDASIYAGHGEEGYVKDIRYVNTNKDLFVSVKVEKLKSPSVGDKFTPTFHAQKGVIGSITPSINMPRLENGVTPDIIINSHAIPSRMTMGMLSEIIYGTRSATILKRLNIDPFSNYDKDLFSNILYLNSLDVNSSAVMISGITGEYLSGTVFIGICQYSALKHVASDKFQLYSYNGIPTLGVANKKEGLRIDEMSIRVALTSGCSKLVKSSLCEMVNQMDTVYCKNCGIEVYQKRTGQKNKIYNCGICNDNSLGKKKVSGVFNYINSLAASTGIIFKMKF